MGPVGFPRSRGCGFMAKPAILTDDLCLHCGLCCDGTLFRAVELQSGDNSVRLKELGLPIRAVRHIRGQVPQSPSVGSAATGLSFPQPCSALGAGCRCRIYPDRPMYCRQFECHLFQQVRQRRETTVEALRLIRSARRRAARVRRLLAELGDDDVNEPLGLRFRRMRKQMESGTDNLAASSKPVIDPSMAQDLFQQLSLAVHQLNLLLGERFYPNPG